MSTNSVLIRVSEDIAVKGLAYAVHWCRRDWPTRDIHRAIREDLDTNQRDFRTVALAAINAAHNPETRSPGGIKTTYPAKAGQCAKCAQREAAEHAKPDQPHCPDCHRKVYACRCAARASTGSGYAAFQQARRESLQTAATNPPASQRRSEPASA